MTSLILITHNSLDPAIASLDRLTREQPAARVVVVDNGSDDGTADVVRERFPSVAVVQLGNETDWAVAERAGRAFAGPDAAVVWLNEASRMVAVDVPELVGV